jgi:hypothetical protein
MLGEAEKLLRALAALDPRGRSTPASPTASPRPRPASTPLRRAQTRRPRRRTAPGATKARVLGALTDGNAMTAGEVASATGLPTATVSTTLSRLAKSAQVLKAERGYRLPSQSHTNGSAAPDADTDRSSGPRRPGMRALPRDESLLPTRERDSETSSLLAAAWCRRPARGRLPLSVAERRCRRTSGRTRSVNQLASTSVFPGACSGVSARAENVAGSP